MLHKKVANSILLVDHKKKICASARCVGVGGRVGAWARSATWIEVSDGRGLIERADCLLFPGRILKPLPTRLRPFINL